jgi:hypothetical protein
MDEQQALKAIRSMIKSYNQIQLDGGTYSFSKQYRQFIIKRKLVLKMFGLEANKDNYWILTAYPLSLHRDILKPPAEETCPYRPFSIIKAFHWAVHLNKLGSRVAGKSWTLDNQVNFVYNNLIAKLEDNLGLEL